MIGSCSSNELEFSGESALLGLSGVVIKLSTTLKIFHFPKADLRKVNLGLPTNDNNHSNTIDCLLYFLLAPGGGGGRGGK